MYAIVQVGHGWLASASSTTSATSAASTSSMSLTSPIPGPGAVVSVALPAAPAKRLQSLEAVVGTPAPSWSHRNPGVARPCCSRGLHSGTNVAVHVPGGGDLEAGTGRGQLALGDHCSIFVNGQQPVALRRLEECPHLCEGAVHLCGHKGNIGEGDTSSKKTSL